MKTKAKHFVVLLLVIALYGCGLSQSQRYKIVSDTYTSTLQSLSIMGAAGQIDKEAAVKIEAVRKPLGEEIDALESALLAGRGIDFEWIISRVNSKIDKLIIEQAKIERSSK